MTDERLAEIAEYFRCGNSVLIGVNQKTALELLQALKAERKFARKTLAVNRDAIERITELEAAIKDEIDRWPVINRDHPLYKALGDKL